MTVEKPFVCSGCEEPCHAKFVDNSFSHAFGVEILHDFLSDCCEEACLDSDTLTPVPEPELIADLEQRSAEV